MGEFISGRGRSRTCHTYPDPRFAGSIGPFARNDAIGPGSDVNAAPGGTTISWLLIGSGSPGTLIPVTPISNAELVIRAVLGLHNVGVSAQDVTVQIVMNGTPLPVPAIDISIPSASFAELPILAFAQPPVGSTANFSLVVTGSTDVNIVNFEPGGVIPFAETHVMEHGLYVLEGKAVYRLNQDWVEVEAGDFMWLRAFCPQACYAGGPGNFRYLLYKDVNRHARLGDYLGGRAR